MNLETWDLALVNEELGQRSHSKSVILDFHKLLFNAVRTPKREQRELSFLRVQRRELIDKEVITYLVALSLKYFTQCSCTKLAKSGHLFLNIAEPGESTTHIVGWYQACIVGYDGNLLISGEVKRLDWGCVIS